MLTAHSLLERLACNSGQPVSFAQRLDTARQLDLLTCKVYGFNRSENYTLEPVHPLPCWDIVRRHTGLWVLEQACACMQILGLPRPELDNARILQVAYNTCIPICLMYLEDNCPSLIATCNNMHLPCLPFPTNPNGELLQPVYLKGKLNWPSTCTNYLKRVWTLFQHYEGAYSLLQQGFIASRLVQEYAPTSGGRLPQADHPGSSSKGGTNSVCKTTPLFSCNLSQSLWETLYLASSTTPRTKYFGGCSCPCSSGSCMNKHS
jgi:hypothetical protein